MSTYGVDSPYSNEIWSVIPRLSAMRSNCSTVGFALPQLIRFRYCLLHPNRVANSVSLTFFSLMLSSSQSLFPCSLLLYLKVYHIKKAPLPVVRAERPISYAYSAEPGGKVSVGSTNPSPVVSPSSVSKGEPHNSWVVTISTTSTTGFM